MHLALRHIQVGAFQGHDGAKMLVDSVDIKK